MTIKNEELLRALLDGKKLQRRWKTAAGTKEDEWGDCDVETPREVITLLIDPRENDLEYRIKPEGIHRYAPVLLVMNKGRQRIDPEITMPLCVNKTAAMDMARGALKHSDAGLLGVLHLEFDPEDMTKLRVAEIDTEGIVTRNPLETSGRLQRD